MAVPAAVDCAGTVTIVERSITIGDGTDYAWDGSTQDYGNTQVRNNDVPKGHGDGDVSQHDFYAPRMFMFPISIAPAPNESPTRAQLWARWTTLRDAWARSFDTDLTLQVVEPGETSQYLGRPNACTPDLTGWRKGQPLIRVLLAFRCADPTRY